MCIERKQCAYHPVTKEGVTIRICVVCGDYHKDDTYSLKARRRMIFNYKPVYVAEWRKLKVSNDLK